VTRKRQATASARTRRYDRRREGGFTIVEIMTVVLIIGIIGMLALPAVNDFFTDEKIGSAADSVVTAIYYARNLAITTGEDHRVAFDTAAESFEVERRTGGTPPNETFATVQSPMTKRDYVVVFDNSAGAGGVDLYSALFGSDQFVRFDQIGTPLNVGQVVVRYGGRQRTISVTPTSCAVAM